MTTRSTLVWALALAALTALAAPAPAQEEPTEEVSRGATLFRLYCASCHGKEGAGDGPIAKDLKTRPPDLTRIADRRKGRFPEDEMELIIDGRAEIEAHGSSEMPVWGLSFRQPGRVGDQEEEVWLQIRQLIHHLRSIQRGPIVEEDDS